MLGDQIDGVVGIVKWGHYNAAAIHGYRVRRDAKTNVRTVRARVVMADSFKLKQRPLVFEAPFQGGVLRWPIESFDLVENEITARLGDLEMEGSWNHGLSGQTSAR